MKRILIIIASVIILAACSNKQKAESTNTTMTPQDSLNVSIAYENNWGKNFPEAD